MNLFMWTERQVWRQLSTRDKWLTVLSAPQVCLAVALVLSLMFVCVFIEEVLLRGWDGD